MRLPVCLVLLALVAGCSRRSADSEPPSIATSKEGLDTRPLELAGLHNVFRISDRIYSGSSPEGDTGFQSLQKLGVRTIVSVDGARPEVERARKFGLRYVHLPIGYDGVPREQALRIARAVRDLPGPVYIHCHHGKHRGPAAAAVVHLCLDDKCSVAHALAEMRRAGTDPHYAGLYAAPEKMRRPTAQELDRVSADFPEVAQVPALAQLMVDIDQRWDNLKQARTAGWKTPADHPDIDPPHEALQLREHFREMGRLADAKDRPADFRTWLAESEQAAAALEEALRAKPPAASSLDKSFAALRDRCTHCHTHYRDVPKPGN
jgi:protein tyrosine phosphatase (PTP) superfamily phosphohydrolase (DUF442 family)